MNALARILMGFRRNTDSSRVAFLFNSHVQFRPEADIVRVPATRPLLSLSFALLHVRNPPEN